MTQSEKPGLLKRIRAIKSSLDKAEKSFENNSEMRGELDLMLAEAEMNNLRKKQGWSWNRQLLAICMALFVVVASLGGYYYARGRYKTRYANEAKAAIKAAQQNMAKSGEKIVEALPSRKDVGQETVQQKDEKPVSEEQFSVSKSEMQELIRSARKEMKD